MGFMSSSFGWWARLVEALIVGRFGLARLFPKRYRLIPRLDGQPLLRQFLVLRLGPTKRPWIEVYLHSFVNGETAEWFHRHRWGHMVSVVLSGRFCEERFPGQLFWVHYAPDFYYMDRSTVHRLHWAGERTWSLFFGFGNDARWGYYRRVTPEAVQYTSWQDMIPPAKRVRSL